MSQQIKNMRIHLYGVRGSSPTFPRRQEREALQAFMGQELLRGVLEDLARHVDGKDHLDCTLTEVIGGPLNEETLVRYRQKFKIKEPPIYGGWTTCARIETSDGHDIVLDCGTGFTPCARDLQIKWADQEERHLHIFGTHSHLDHTMGFDQAAVCFDPRNTIHMYGNYHFLCSLDSYLGIFSKSVREALPGLRTRVNYKIMLAAFLATEITDNGNPDQDEKSKGMERVLHDRSHPIEIGKTRITAFSVHHPTPCLAYKIEHGGKRFVFCTDHELRHSRDPSDPKQKASDQAEARLAEHALDADVLYRDGQYLRSDYDGVSAIGASRPVPRMGWGHSCIEDVQEMGMQCRVKRTYIGHHDPDREWLELRRIDDALARKHGKKIKLAHAGTVMDL
jgi:hypothetical protein